MNRNSRPTPHRNSLRPDARQPETSKYEGMPKAAIHTGSIDLIMPPGKMGAALERLLSQRRVMRFVFNEAEAIDEYTQISNIVPVNTAFKLSDYQAVQPTSDDSGQSEN